MFTHTHLYIFVYMCTHRAIYINSHIYVHTCMHIQIYIYVCACVRVCMCMCVCIRGSLYGIMAKVLDCSLKIGESELQPHYYIHFRNNTLGKDMTPLSH